MPSTRIVTLFEDSQGRFWISTNREISRLSFDESLGDEEIRVSINNFNSGKGIPGHAGKDFWGNTIQENQKIDRGAMEFKSTLN